MNPPQEEPPHDAERTSRQTPKESADVRTLIAALWGSLDGFIEGPNGEVDWVDTPREGRADGRSVGHGGRS
jgi:hypothetical protein